MQCARSAPGRGGMEWKARVWRRGGSMAASFTTAAIAGRMAFPSGTSRGCPGGRRVREPASANGDSLMTSAFVRLMPPSDAESQRD